MPRSILVVDDQRSVRFALSAYFRARGVEVDTASDLGSAEKLLRAGHYDGVVADLRLSGAGSTEGLAVLELSRTLHPKASLVLLSAYADSASSAAARERGARAVLLKPVPLAQVAGALFPDPGATEAP